VGIKVSTEEFLRAIWGEQVGVAELAFGKPLEQNRLKTGAFWAKPFNYPEGLGDLVTTAMGSNGKLNIYFGVCLRRDSWPRTGPDGKEQKRGTIDNVTSASCLWIDVDFKTTPKEEALKSLRSFPVKPSIGTMSGGGFQAFWMLREPVTTDDLKKISPVNSAIAKALGGDHTHDLARVLRMPNTLNVKYAPPVMCEVVAWRPELRHNLMDFDFLVIGEAVQEAATATAPPAPTESGPVDVSSLPCSDFVRRVIREGLPAYIEFRKATDSPDKFQERQKSNALSRSEADAWMVSQLLAVRLTDAQIYAIYRDPSNKIGEKYRERRDGDKYLGVTVREMRQFSANHPKVSPGSAAVKVGQKLSRKFEDKKFELVKVIKTAYEPPIYEFMTRVIETGDEHRTRCTLDDAVFYQKFRTAFFAAHDLFPPMMKQENWEAQINSLKFEIHEVDHEIAGPRGEVEAALEEWMSTGQQDSSSPETSLQYLPYLDGETGKTYMKLNAFMQYLAGQKIEAKRRVVTDVLKSIGYQRETRRFGKITTKVWTKESSNGQKNVPLYVGQGGVKENVGL